MKLEFFIKFKDITENFNQLINDYVTVMKDLNFTMAITNEQQQQIWSWKFERWFKRISKGFAFSFFPILYCNLIAIFCMF